MGIGVMELFVAIPFVILSLALPAVSLVLVFMTYRKVSNIEKRLGG